MQKRPPQIPCEQCTGCSACAQSCPAGCISMQPDSEGFLSPKVNESACLHCYLCERICPVPKAPYDVQVLHEDSKACALICNNSHILQIAGSGGAFSLMAKNILDEGGVVIGAAWTADWQVEHIAVYNWQQYERIAGTKYVQSRIGNTMKLTHKLLLEGKKVLFGGTGCQIAGLQAFLKKSYPGLITVNIACYGAPSPGVWSRYLSELQTSRKLGEIKEVVFRKKIDNNSLTMFIEGTKGTYKHYVYGDPFGWGLVNDVINRPCCEHCLFKGAASGSDITIGDARGIEDYDSSVKAIEGVSVIAAHTPQGRELVGKLKPDCRYFRSLPLPGAICQNMGIIDSINSHPSLRKALFKKYKKSKSIIAALANLRKERLKTKVIKLCKRAVNKLKRMLHLNCL